MTELNEMSNEDLIKMIQLNQDLLKKEKELRDKKIEKRREYQKKYRSTEKGKKANRAAQKRRYKPTGNKPGRTRKNQTNLQKLPEKNERVLIKDNSKTSHVCQSLFLPNGEYKK